MIENVGQSWRQYVIAIIANLGLMSSSFASGWFSSAEAKLQDPAQSPLPAPITRDEAAWIGSLVAAGAIVGPFIGGPAGKYLGRRWAILLGTVPLLAGWVLTATAVNVYMLYAARIFFGIAVGILFTNLPIYCGEIATDAARGAIGSLVSLSIVVGVVIVFSIGPFVAYNTIAYVGAGIVGVFAILMYFMPESPVYHLMRDDRDSAEKNLSLIRGQPAIELKDEMKKMCDEVAIAKQEVGRLSDLWASKANVRALAICCTLLALQPFSGINAVMVYATNIFSNAGIELEPAIASIIYSIFQLFGSFITIFVIDRAGRRFLLLISISGVIVALSLFAIYSQLEFNNNPIIENIRILPVLLLGFNVVIYSVGFGPVCWALVGEVFAVKIRTQASLIVNAMHWTINFFVFRYFYSIVDTLGMHTAFWIFAGVSLLALIFVFFVVPETKGKSFQEIQDLLEGRPRDLEQDKANGTEKPREIVE